MPTVEQLRNRLVNKLKELFQLDQPDLDFGFYRIMHAKSKQITEFLDKDLLSIIESAFGQMDARKTVELKAAYEKEIQTALDYGAADPEKVPKVKEARARYEAAGNHANTEGEIYDHLYRFFERYYDDGDFISRRYLTRETSDRAAPFAVPYNGEELKLVWANMDQYYIKTTEYFNHFTFDLHQAKEIQAQKQAGGLFLDADASPRRVHFRIISASEGEHGNIKASDSSKRFFIIHREKPLEINESGELVVNFEYRPDPEKGSAQEGTWREQRNRDAVQAILSALDAMPGMDEYKTLLIYPAPTDKDKIRPLLAKYINQYTARNTYDYFIHKDLGSFLQRELDFFIKNEVMRLDDIENADAPAVESYLAKIKVLRQIAHKLIDFLAQLEDFQKRLWLKKKFVVETQYCITLDRVPEELYPEICANDAQREEWVRLFAIDEIKAEEAKLMEESKPGYTVPLTVEFLKTNPFLVLDTRFFNEVFKARLLASLQDLDEQCNGLLIHSENFQALNMLQERYHEQVKCIYIDPPYNTGTDGFNYKDSYRHSSWLSLLNDRIAGGINLLTKSGVLLGSIDDTEVDRFRNLFENFIGREGFLGTFVWKRRITSSLAQSWISTDHEYVVTFSKDASNVEILGDTKDNSKYNKVDKDGRKYSSMPLTVGMNRFQRPNQWYALINPNTGKEYWPPNNRVWCYYPPTMEIKIAEDRIIWPDDYPGSKMTAPRLKAFDDESQRDRKPISTWISEKNGSLTEDSVIELVSARNEEGTRWLNNLFRITETVYPKPTSLLESLIGQFSGTSGIVMDYFSGSGTTAHAVINLNRKDSNTRKYILIEIGDYFDTILKPRIQKVIYSKDWKDGKPVARETGISHYFKYILLESYEDTLNNLAFDENPVRHRILAENQSLLEDFMLRYLLEVETKGSQSLLNIAAFSDPAAYSLKIKKTGSDEYALRPVDLLETFNYLIGLRVTHIALPQTFTAKFNREIDPDLPEDQNTRLVVKGSIRQTGEGDWWFRKVEGWVSADPLNPNNGLKEKVLIVWRKLTGNLEQDNLVLDEWFKRNRINTRDFEFDIIYVNGSNNLPNLKQEGDTWKVRLIEEEFMKRMWDVDNF